MFKLVVALHGRSYVHTVLRPCLISLPRHGSNVRFSSSHSPAPQPGPSNSSHESDQGSFSARKVISGLFWAPVALYFVNNIYTIAQVEGGSMSPSMAPEANKKDIVLLNKYAASTENVFKGKGIFAWMYPHHSDTHKQNLHIGDVIFFISPLDPRQRCTKRILAMPGDIVSTTAAGSSSSPPKEGTMIRIPPGHIWVEGDASASEYRPDGIDVPSNRKSRDSRTYGPIPLALVIGRVDCILVPFSRFGAVPPRPNFDLKRALARRQARERNESFVLPLRGPKAHPDDSPVSNYTEWEWYSSDDLNKRTSDAKDDRSNARRSRRGEEQAEMYRKSLGRMSRGGQLGQHLDDIDDE